MFDFDARRRRLADRLSSAGADAAVLVPGPNLRYLLGIDDEQSERFTALFVTPDDQPVLVLPEMSVASASTEAPDVDVRGWTDRAGPDAVLEDAVEDLGLSSGRVLLDDRMWTVHAQDLRAHCPDATVDLASEVLEPLRIRKDDAEVDAIERASGLADRVSEAIRELGADAVGRTERDLAREIERRLLEDGAGEELSFPVMVGAGPNGARPHHTPGDREVEPGDPVVLDFGARVDGYPGDQTRTVVFDGEPPTEFQTVFETVREAQDAAVSAVEPGTTAAAVDRAARGVIEDAGYADAFTHRTGHGVGLEVHEPPYVVGGNDRALEAGMVFSVEPGVYLEGAFGVRIEDLVVVTDEGARRLNGSPRGWTVP